MSRHTLSITLIISLLTTFCGNKTPVKSKDGAGSFCCKNGHLAFTNFKDNIGSIFYTKNIYMKASQLTFPKEGWDEVFDLSKDLSKILYINYPDENYEICNVCIYNIKSKEIDTLLRNQNLILDAKLSNNGRRVYFVTASEINNFSPFVSKAPHGMDIFEFAIESKKLSKLTDLNAYAIQGLAMTPCDSILAVNIYDKKGLGFISTTSGKFKKLNINSPRNSVQVLFEIVELRADSMIYQAPYELYKHNFRTNQSEFILRCPEGNQFYEVAADDTWTNLVFSCNDNIYSYNIPTKILTKVTFRIE